MLIITPVTVSHAIIVLLNISVKWCFRFSQLWFSLFAEIFPGAWLQETVFNCAIAKSFTVFSSAAELSRKTLYDVIRVSLFLKLPRTEQVPVPTINQRPDIKHGSNAVFLQQSWRLKSLMQMYLKPRSHLHIDGVICFFFLPRCRYFSLTRLPPFASVYL